jgi:tetratricopeptide (TPR) repeat protein
MAKAKPKIIRGKGTAGLGGLLLFVLILAAYANHFQNGFHMDDGHTIVDNPAIRDLGNTPRFFTDARTFSVLPSNQSYRPLISTMLAIDYRLAHGFAPFWFHLSTFSIFVLLALLLALVIRHLLQADFDSRASLWIALAAAAWYALNPANGDTINYVIVSSEVLSTLGVIASFALYFAFPRQRRYFLYVLPAALAILAKPTAAIFPVLFALFLLLFPEGKGRRRNGIGLAMELAPAFLICAAVLIFVQKMTPPGWVAGAPNPRGYLLAQPYVALLYFKTFFWPTGLNADYDLQPFVSMADGRFWIGIAFVVLVGGGAIATALRRKTRLVGFGLLWYLISLSPASLFPLAEVMNDHRAFLSYIGLAIAGAGAAELLLGWLNRVVRWPLAVVVGLFLCANAWLTFERNKVWRTEETLWRDVVQKSPRNGRGLMTYGITLVNDGKFAEAIEYLRRAQSLTPPYSVLLINLATAEGATGQTAAAEKDFREALRLAPLSPDTYIYYASWLLAQGRADEARENLQRALELRPGDPAARRLLAQTGARAAETHGEAGDAALRDGKFAEAIREYDAALQTAPDFVGALNNLAWLLSTCPDSSLRDATRALALSKKADQVAGGQDAVVLRTLAAAYAENGDFSNAIATGNRATQLALAQGNSGLASRLEADLARYRDNLPLVPAAPSILTRP